jgi:hypothetical protein
MDMGTKFSLQGPEKERSNGPRVLRELGIARDPGRLTGAGLRR